MSAIVRILCSFLIIFALMPHGIRVQAQDLVPSQDLTGGASVFVFRNAKKPQEKAAVKGFVSDRGSSARGKNQRVNAQLAAAARKKRQQSSAVTARNRARERNRRLALSNTLTAQAETLLDTRQTDKAIATFRSALKQNPKNVNATAGLSEALTVKGIDVAGAIGSDAALPYLTEAVKLDSKNYVAYAKAGEIYDAKADNVKAAENYEKAIAISPDVSTVYAPLGLIYLEQGEIAKADAILTKAEAASGHSADVYYLRGLVRYRQNRNDEAVTAFQRASDLDPANTSARYYLAATYDRMGRGNESNVAYMGIVERDPNFAPAWFDMGVAAYNRGEYEKAVNAYSQAIKLDEGNAEAHANLASAYRQLERYPEANEQYKRAAVTIKNDPDLYSEWGYCLGKTNEWDKATARLLTAQELSPNAVDYANLGWGYYNASRVDMEAKRDAEARAKLEIGKAFLQKAVAANPRLDAAYLNLGSTHNSLGEHEAAVQVLNQAVGMRQDWVIALNQLGLAYRGTNNLSAAISNFTRATALDANNVFGLFSLGEVYYLNGNKREARRVHNQLRRINPAMAGRLEDVITGKIVIDEAQRQIRKKVPRIPGIPY